MIRTRTEPLHWGYVGYFAVVHILGAIGIWYGFVHASAAVVTFSILYFFAVHLAITCAAHRLYAHSAYWASQELQYLANLLFSGAAQGSIIWWSGKHAYHHAREDTADDPHSPLHGFFHSHMGWILRRSGAAPAPAQYMRKQYQSPEYEPARWQDKNYWWLGLVMTLLVPLVFGAGVNDITGGVLVGVFARLVFQYHLTWIVNSVGHTYGTRGTISRTATNLWWLAIPTVGESLHANHHDRPRSYRFGTHWYDIDLGWYTIKLCMLLGLAGEIKRA